MRARYDVIVVGAGAGGGTVAAHAAEAGLHVLLVERGPEIAPADVPRDHLRNTMSARYPNLLHSPAGSHPHVVEQDGGVEIVEPPDWRHNNTANVVGGGTLTWGMQAWRFDPDDFRMASRYGVPAGSSLADWPIGYEDLEPYYARAEWELGVAGGEDTRGHDHPSYPLPPFPRSEVDAWLTTGAERCGWSTQPVPLAINTIPFGGRPACVRCNECIGFACPVNAKNGSRNTMIPRARATGLCEVMSDTRVVKVTSNYRGLVDGVELLIGPGVGTRHRRTVRARSVVLAAGAIETARLLMLSSSSLHACGLGNDSDHVGRHLQNHFYPVAMGVLPPDVAAVRHGPGVGTAVVELTHGNPGVIGGALLANDFVKTPISFWETSLPPDVPRWGAANKAAMRQLFGRVVDIRGPVQEIPTPDLRATLDPTVRDAAGIPVIRLSGRLHPETIRTARFIQDQAVRWLHESGAERAWTTPPTNAAYHQAGTARMSARPEQGVTDTSGRVHGHDNLFVADASVHVTNGAFNPALTVFALAMRTSESVIDALA